MNITLELLKFLSGALRDMADEFLNGTEPHDALHDAADALDDAREIIEEEG